VLLTRLCEGQRATVLQLPVAVVPAAKEAAARLWLCPCSWHADLLWTGNRWLGGRALGQPHATAVPSVRGGDGGGRENCDDQHRLSAHAKPKPPRPQWRSCARVPTPVGGELCRTTGRAALASATPKETAIGYKINCPAATATGSAQVGLETQGKAPHSERRGQEAFLRRQTRNRAASAAQR